MNDETFHLVAAVVMIVATLALVAIAFVAAVVARDARRLLRHLDEELPETIRQARSTASAAERLTTNVTPRLERLDRLADEAEITLAEVREAAVAAGSIVRGPADVVEGARRTAESVGRGLVSGAERLRRRMAADSERVDAGEEVVGG